MQTIALLITKLPTYRPPKYSILTNIALLLPLVYSTTVLMSAVQRITNSTVKSRRLFTCDSGSDAQTHYCAGLNLSADALLFSFVSSPDANI